MILILSFSVLSCAKTQSLGAGVTVDRQGNLKIDAPLYVLDKNPKKPDLKPAPASMNHPVDAGIYLGDDAGNSMEVTGGIVKGRLSLTLKKTDEEFWAGAASIWNVPAELFTGGADVQIGELYLEVDYSDYSSPIMLYSSSCY